VIPQPDVVHVVPPPLFAVGSDLPFGSRRFAEEGGELPLGVLDVNDDEAHRVLDRAGTGPQQREQLGASLGQEFDFDTHGESSRLSR